MTDYDLVHKVNNFIEKSGLSETSFGLKVMNDGKLVNDLRDGRDVKRSTYKRILAFIENFEPDSVNSRVVKHGGPSNGGSTN